MDQLDAGAPRISDICERDASRLVLADWLIELDALRFDLLDEGQQVLDIEADVVEHASFGRSLRGGFITNRGQFLPRQRTLHSPPQDILNFF